MTDELRDALARVIDPEAWELHDDIRVAARSQKLRDYLVEESRTVATNIINSGLMTDHKWDRAEYIQARQRIIDRTSRRGKCYSEEDGLDGYFMHDPRCPHWPDGAIGGSNCIN